MSTVAAGDTIIAGDNNNLETRLAVSEAAWTTWTPTLSNLTLGNGTTTANYIQVGKTVLFRFNFLLGTTSAVGTNPAFTPPVTISSTWTGKQIGIATLSDTGTAIYHGLGMESSATIQITVFNVSATYLTRTAITNLIPHTWASTDFLFCCGFYEAA